jgi:flagellar basal body-associated protein FliL
MSDEQTGIPTTRAESEVISLENIVAAEPGAPAVAPPDTATVSPATPPPPQQAESDEEVAQALAQIDEILDLEDPQFTAELRTMKIDPAAVPAELEPLNVDEVLRASKLDKSSKKLPNLKKALSPEARGLQAGLTQLKKRRERAKAFLHRLRTSAPEMAKEGLQALGRGLIGGLKAILASLGRLQKKFSALPRQGKMALAGILILAIAIYFVVRTVAQGNYMPSLETRFLTSFGKVADHSYEYDDNEPMEDFNSPLRHPEYVVLLDKVVVNLKPTSGSSTNPMGMFEFYVEAGSQEAAVEINDREKEVLDVVQRTLENMPYEELITIDGKSKIKLILRKNLNSFLTRGRVRKVFFKTIVLKE